MEDCLNCKLDICLYEVLKYTCRQLNLLSTATPAVGAWLVPIDQLKSSLNKLDTEGTLRVCAVMGCIMTEALEVGPRRSEAGWTFALKTTLLSGLPSAALLGILCVLWLVHHSSLLLCFVSE